MEFKAFLIKYGELGVKGKNRYLFEDALVRQIRYALKKTDGEFEVTKENGRIYATAVSDFDFDEAVEALKTVFGIIGICPVVQREDNGFADLADTVIKYFDSAYPDKHFSFKVNARRARKNYPMDSMEINMEMGGRLLDAFPELSVDVHIRTFYFRLKSVIRLIFIQLKFRVRAVCRSAQPEKQ